MGVMDVVGTIGVMVAILILVLIIRFVVKKKLKETGLGKVIWKKTKNGIKVLFASGQITAALPRVVPAIG
jgi:hypothetical protein